MTRKMMIAALAAAGVMGTAGWALYSLGMQRGMRMPEAPAMARQAQQGQGQQSADGSTAKIDPDTGRKVLYWHDPMVPGPKFDAPGKSPFMDMQLVPVFADEGSDDGTVKISPRVQQNLGVRTAEVERGALAPAIEVVGNVAYNERDLAMVAARANGFVERLYLRAPLDAVKAGQPLAELYVPDWVAAQEEYLAVKRMGKVDGVAELLDAARQRMRLAGMTEAQIRRVAASGAVQARLTIAAPVAGVVTELHAREGMTVLSGAPLFTITGLQTVWVNAEVPESQAAQVRPGMRVQAATPAVPGETFTGKVEALLPQVDAATRTAKARIALANPKRQLVPGMFVNVRLDAPTRDDVLLVPSEAVIATGRRHVVIVAQDEGKFMPVEVQIGSETGGKTEIRAGLQAGQKVVASGQFLIDSEASLKGVLARLEEAPGSGDQADTTKTDTHRGSATVEAIDQGEVTLSHGPIPSLKWGPMTMGFTLPASGMPKEIAVGDQVEFEFRQTKDGMFEIVSIARAGKTPSGGAK